jgi:cytochrome c oxidase cbb3-type subunit 3
MSGLRRMVVLMAAVTLPACEREAREFRSSTGEELALQLPPQTSYRIATPPDPLDRDASTTLMDEEESHYERNAPSLSEGKWLFVRFNCHGCHASGGGGDMGPPLIDAQWRYGDRPRHVLASILQGRPNGMPAFASRITRKQAWELVAYVRSMSGLGPGDSTPGRDDHMKMAPPANTIKNAPPKEVGPPPIPKVKSAGEVARSAP